MSLPYAVLLALAMTASAAASDAGQGSGASLYEGRAATGIGTADVAGAVLPASRFACKGCHGRDGRGGGESRAPPIDGAALFRTASDRPAYDEVSLATAIAQGRTPTGRDLSIVMPRYALPAETMAGLVRYLDELPALQRRGVSATAITFAVPAPPHSRAFATAYASKLEAELGKALGAAQVYGRTPRVIALPSTPEQAISTEASIFAVVAAPTAEDPATAELASKGVPVLMPLAPLSGDEDKALYRGLSASWRDISRNLTDALNGRSITTLTVVTSEPSHALLRALRRNRNGTLAVIGPEGVPSLAHQPGHAALLLLGGIGAASIQQLAAALPAELPVFVPSREKGTEIIAALKGRRQLTVIIEAPALVEMALNSGGSALDTHVEVTAAVLAAALRAAGPDPTRASFALSFNSITLAKHQLDYTANPLTGSSSVYLVDVDNDK